MKSGRNQHRRARGVDLCRHSACDD
jgi:hypothetical protein